MRRRASGSQGIASSDTASLASAVYRTRIVGGLLLVTACALLACGVAWSRGLESNPGGLLPGDATAVVILDLSLSIADEDYTDMRFALRRLISDGTPLGVVVFSDVPYELLPPGSPASALDPMLRLLVPQGKGPPVNPWMDSFRAGTRISAALDLARDMLERDEIENGSIVLVSDLETAPDDVPALARSIDGVLDAGIELKVFGLAPSENSKLIFRGLVGNEAFLPSAGAEPSRPKPRAATNLVPLGLFAFGGLLFLALAATELLTGRLGLPATPRAEGGRA